MYSYDPPCEPSPYEIVSLLEHDELCSVLRLMATEKGRAAMREPYAVTNGKRETLNDRLHRLLNRKQEKQFLGSTARKRGVWLWDHDDGVDVDLPSIIKGQLA